MAEAPTTPVPIHPDDPDDEWQTATNNGRAVRVRLLTGALVLLVVLAGGFWGGVVAEKHHGSGSSGSSAASRLASIAAAARAAGGGGGSGLGGGTGGGGGLGAGAGGATTGTVIDVQGNVVDISDSNGNIVKITLGPSTTVTRTAAAKPADLQIGDTVVVLGPTGSPTSVRATAQGVSTGFRGFGGGGGSASFNGGG